MNPRRFQKSSQRHASGKTFGFIRKNHIKKEKVRKDGWKIEKLIEDHQQSVRERLKDIENIYKHILKFEQNNRGNPRMT